MDPLVSVIIPVKKYHLLLERCLSSIRSSGYRPLEILVIARNSSDVLRETADIYGARLIQAPVGRSTAKNIGVSESRGIYVLFMDHDHEIAWGTIKSCVSKCLEGYEAVKIPEEFVGWGFWGRSSATWKNTMAQAWGEEGGIPRFYLKKKLTARFREDAIWWEDQEHYNRLSDEGIQVDWSEGSLIHHESGDLRGIISSYMVYGRSTKRIEQKELLYNEKALLTLKTLKTLFKREPISLPLFLGTITITFIKGISFLLGALRDK
ncbi:glycosyltransferase [Candidatus Bathyarchaeota archaeon]|nr:glycosyltransferase [Candidatus Bathyarchaeota archaeon]